MFRYIAAVLLAFSLFACSPGFFPPSTSSTEGQVVTLTNQDRARAGLPPLTWNATLGQNAEAWSQAMSNYGVFAHQNLSYLLSTAEYTVFRTIGENILMSPTPLTASQIEAAFMASPEHRANILNPAFRYIGVGISDNGRYVAVEFGG